MDTCHEFQQKVRDMDDELHYRDWKRFKDPSDLSFWPMTYHKGIITALFRTLSKPETHGVKFDESTDIGRTIGLLWRTCFATASLLEEDVQLHELLNRRLDVVTLIQWLHYMQKTHDLCDTCIPALWFAEQLIMELPGPWRQKMVETSPWYERQRRTARSVGATHLHPGEEIQGAKGPVHWSMK